MATRIKKVHYVEDFKFKVNIPLDKELFYQATCKTLGVNTFVASWYYEDDVWVCENCAIDGDEITIFLTDHKLPAGKLLCHVESMNEDNIGIECSEIDPNIVLTFIPPTGGTDIDEIDEEQTLDIIRLDNELKEIKEKYADFDSSLTEIETNYNNAAKAHHERLDNIDKAISNVENSINENKKEITSLDKFTSTLSGRLDEEVNKINDRITNIILNSSTGEVDLSDVYQQINENKTTIALLRNYIDALKIPEEVDLTPINDKLALLEQGLNNLEAFEHDKYLTEHQDISHLATKEELEAYQLKGNYVDEKELEKYQLKGDYATTSDVDAINSRLDYFDKINHDSFATKEYVDEAITKIDVTEQLEHYVTQDELQNELDLLETDIADNYYNKEEVDTKITDAVTGGKVDLSNYVTTSQLNTAIENIPEYDDTELDFRISNLEKIDHSKYLTSHQDISNLTTKNELQTAIDAIDIPETDLTNYYTKSEVDIKLADAVTGGQVDLSNYPTKQELNTAISNIPEYDDTNIKNRLTSLEGIDHSNYATKNSLNNYQPKGNYLTQHQDISHLATKTEVQSAIDAIELPVTDLSNYYTKTEVNKQISDAVDNIEFPEFDATDIKNRLTSLEGIDHSIYATKNSLNNYQPKGDYALTSQLEQYQPKGDYLTEHQDISNLVSKTELDKAIENFGSGTASAEFLNTSDVCPDNENVLYFLYQDVEYIHTEYAIKDE